MKNNICLNVLFIALFTFIYSEYTNAQTQVADYYNIKSGVGNGLRFWNGSNNHKIHMGNTAAYQYGPVTSYSIKMSTSQNVANGWTWGISATPPVAALNTQGHFQIKGWMKNMNRNYYFGERQRLYGDNSAALHWISNHSDITELIMKDKESNIYGKLYGNENGLNFGLLDGDGDWSYIASKDSYTAFRINNSEKMRIISDGNVGIGIANPSERLHIKGNALTTGEYISTNANQARYINGNYGVIHRNDGSNYWILVTESGDQYGSWNEQLRPFKINNKTGNVQLSNNTLNIIEGNVGIGTATPNNKLDVCGIIRAKEIKVESGWCDYVFYDDYDLPTLEEEEKHIEENGHLLGFESEQDMEGMIHLGDVTRRQQAKIEEMMLHLIDMKKEMTELKKENERLKTAIESDEK